MANALNVKIGGDIRGLEKALNSAMGKVRDAGRRMQSVGKGLTAAITAPLTALGFTSLKTAADFETLQQSMNILNGSVEEGARNFERLKRFSAGTPFQLADLAKAQNMLQGFGMAADEAFESLSMIGDIAATSGGSIDGIAIAFGQAAAEGMLMSRDIRQLINQRVPALDMLADAMGVARSEIFDLASQGKISFEILQKAFRDATSEGGRFEDGMEKQSQTLNGLFSTLRDNVSMAMGELGDSIAEAFDLKSLVPQLTNAIKEITKRFSELSADSRKQIIKLAGLFAAGGPLLIALGVAAQAISAFAMFVNKRFILITGSVGLALAAFESFNNSINVLLGREDKLIGFMDSMKRGFERITTPITNMVTGALGMTGALDDLKSLFEDLPSITDEVSESTEGMSASNQRATEVVKTLTKTVKDFKVEMNKPPDDVEDPFGIIRPLDKMRLSLTQLMDLQVDFSHRIEESSKSMSKGLTIVKSVADSFTDSFGRGMANIVVEGGKLVDVLKNMKKLLASAIIQKFITAFLTGGLGGSGFFGSGGGLFGKIFNDVLITSDGQAHAFHPDDNILAMKDFSNLGGAQNVHVTVTGRLKGEDIFVSGAQGENTFNR